MAWVERAKPLGGGVKEMFFQTLAFAEYPASMEGTSYRASSEISIADFGLKKITFDAAGEGYYSSQLNNAILYGSKNEDRTSYETLWSTSRKDMTSQKVDISEYKWLKFYVIVTAGAYSGGGGFKNVTLSK